MCITARPQYAPVVEPGLEAKRAELQRQLDAQQAEADETTEDGTPPAPVLTADVPAGTPAAEDAEPDEVPTDEVPTGDVEGDDVEADLDVQAPGWPAGTTARQVLEAAKLLSGRRPQLTVQLDPLSGWARQPDGELLPPSSLREVMRTLPGRTGPARLRPVTDVDLRRLDLGRTQRAVSPALRELLGTLDGERCCFPGCTRHKKLHSHHVQFWSDGGPTDLADLVKRQCDPWSS